MQKGRRIMLASKMIFLFHPSYRRKHYQDILLRKEGRSGSKPINQLTPLPCFPQNMISIFCGLKWTSSKRPGDASTCCRCDWTDAGCEGSSSVRRDNLERITKLWTITIISFTWIMEFENFKKIASETRAEISKIGRARVDKTSLRASIIGHLSAPYFIHGKNRVRPCGQNLYEILYKRPYMAKIRQQYMTKRIWLLIIV